MSDFLIRYYRDVIFCHYNIYILNNVYLYIVNL